MKDVRGFTLIELLIVISIIAILATIGITIFTNIQNKAKDSVRKADVLAISKAMESSYDPVTGTYQSPSGSKFASGQIPIPPEGGSYFGDLAYDNKGFRVCATLSDGSPFCIESEQGRYDELVYSSPFSGTPPGSPTPTPTLISTPGPTNTPTPTSGAGTPTPTITLVYGTPYSTPSNPDPSVCSLGSGSASCNNTSIGLYPLDELGTGLYRGYQGGLYPGGTNVRPPAHDSAGLSLADQIQPLNSAGNPDPNGKYVLLSIGVSNTTIEFSTFMPLANADPVKDPHLVFVDGAQGGMVASTFADPSSNTWVVVNDRITAAGVTPNQVAIAWVKQTDFWDPSNIYRSNWITHRDNLAAIARNLKTKFPNIKIAYYSSRIYAGYASCTLNSEEVAYQTGFSVKWLIEGQINNDPAINVNYNPVIGSVVAPWIAWGPYLWADGIRPSMSGITWVCEDYLADGTHPFTSGKQKVADILLNFFKTDSTAKKWFVNGL